MSEAMDNELHQDTPDEQIIVQFFSSFKPQPSPRFYARMRTTPWQNEQLSCPSHENKKWRLSRKAAWMLSSLIVVLVILVFLIFPSARVAADQIIHFFLPASSDQLNVQVSMSDPNDLLDFSNPSNFPLEVDDVQERAGFEIRQIPSSLGPPALIGARFDLVYNAATLLYKSDDFTLLLTQRPIGNSQDVFSVGPNAQVEFVHIGDVNGEFVVGGWKAVSTTPIPDKTTEPGTVEINAVWDNGLPQSTLRWQEFGYAYEFRSYGVNRASQSQLIFWANGLK
jgi:hypothetical protein